MPINNTNDISVQDSQDSCIHGNILIRPFIREAVLADIYPRPDDNRAESLCNTITQHWEEIRKQYVELMSRQAEVAVSDVLLIDGEEITQRWEGPTRIIDFPRGSCRRKGISILDARACIAICTTDFTSKFWARAGIDEKSDEYGIEPSQIKKVTHHFQEFTRALSDWTFEMAKSYIKDSDSDWRLVRRGHMEISSFGVRDKDIADYIDKLVNSGITMDEMLKQPDINQKLTWYFKRISDIDQSLNTLTKREADSNVIWFTSPTVVELESGEVETREGLYMFRACGDKSQAVGILHDDSKSRHLPRKSALDVARWIGSRT